jgi:hypothetical protein
MPYRGRCTLDLPIDKIREWTEAGWRLGRIAKALDCSKQTVLNRMREAGIPSHPKHSAPGENNGAWKGGRYFDADGYVLVYAPDHPHASKQGRVREHRLVMEQVLGRYLEPGEVVDHIDGNRAHNDPSNLRVFPRNAAHLAATLKGRIPNWTAQGKANIQAAVRLPRPSLSAETKAKMSEAQKRRPPRPPMSQEQREKLRRAALLRTNRPKHSEETKARMRQLALQREAKKRAAILVASGNDAPALPVSVAQTPT